MRLFVLTGAGVSAESGLGTFRDKEGLWTRYDLNEVATPEGFARDPAKVHAFYNARRANLAGAQPNAAHHALARLGQALAATDVVHMHGEMNKVRCEQCETVQAWKGDLSTRTPCGACGRVGGMRPHVVWFGEMPLELERIYEALAGADRFVAIGTSGAVYPAAGFVAEARALGIPTAEINLDPSDNAYIFDDRRYGPATQTVPAWVDEVLNALRDDSAGPT